MIAFKTAAANAVLAAALGFPQLVSADGFTGADVLGWSQEAQESGLNKTEHIDQDR